MSYPADCHPALAARAVELLRAEGGITRIAIGELHTRVCVDGGPSPAIDVELGIGLAQLGRGPFQHQPPSELALESAIAF